MVDIRLARTEALSAAELAEIRTLLVGAFDGELTDDDWTHALGGWHVIAQDSAPVAHAAIVERTLWIGGRPLRVGYVEGVATAPAKQGLGHGRAVMRRAGELIRRDYELGALSTGAHAFYEPLGWERWRGPTYVSRDGELLRTADEDDGIMVLRCPATAELDVTAPIWCLSRIGDDW